MMVAIVLAVILTTAEAQTPTPTATATSTATVVATSTATALPTASPVTATATVTPTATPASSCGFFLGALYLGNYQGNQGQANFTIGPNNLITGGFTVLEVAETTVYTDNWQYNGYNLTTIDLNSVPQGYNCNPNIVGVYNATFSANCVSVHVQIISDSCIRRANTYDGMTLVRIGLASLSVQFSFVLLLVGLFVASLF